MDKIIETMERFYNSFIDQERTIHKNVQARLRILVKRTL